MRAPRAAEGADYPGIKREIQLRPVPSPCRSNDIEEQEDQQMVADDNQRGGGSHNADGRGRHPPRAFLFTGPVALQPVFQPEGGGEGRQQQQEQPIHLNHRKARRNQQRQRDHPERHRRQRRQAPGT